MQTLQGTDPPRVESTTRPDLLLVEERADRSAHVRALLEDAGALPSSIAETGRPEHVRGMLTRRDPCVVLLGLDGDTAEAARRVEAVRLPDRTSPVIALVDDEELGRRAVAHGADDYAVVRPGTRGVAAEALHAAIRRQHEVLVERAERRALRALVERAGDGLVVLDPDLAMVYVNPSAERLFEELSGRAIEMVLARARDARPEGELEVERADGPVCRLQWRLVEGHWAGRPARFVLLRDVTPSLAAGLMKERLAHTERLAAIGTLAAGIAHEINNPLATVIGSRDLAVRLLEDPDGGPDVRELLADMGEGLERIRVVVRDLAQFARTAHTRAEPVQLDEVVRATCHMVGNELRHRAQLQLELGDVRPVPGLRVKVAQVVTNLVLNAIHAIPEGRTSVNRIRVRTWETQGAVRLLVEDTGCGIPDEIRPRVFEPFFTTKADREGTGLGLALCSEIVRLHEGRLWFESTVGVGTRFFVELPWHNRLEAEAPARAARDLPAAPAPVDGPARILAVDDERGILDLIEAAFAGRHAVTAAGSGAEAIERLDAGEEYDVVLCDLMMPDRDGIDVYEHLCASRPELAERVIFLSGGAFSERSQRFLREGGHRLVEKPFRFEELGGEIEKLLAGARRA